MLFNVVGTIAAGKTTLVNSMVGTSQVLFQEPVNEWKEYFDNLNENFCPETIYALQKKIFEYYHSVLVHFRENNDSVVFMERSHMENIYCFILPITLGYLYGENSTACECVLHSNSLQSNTPEFLKEPQQNTSCSKCVLLKKIVALIHLLVSEHNELKTLTKISPLYLPTVSPEELVERKNRRNQPNDKYLTLDFFRHHVMIYKKFINIFGLYETPCLDNETLLELFPNARDIEGIRLVYKDFFEKCEILK